MKKIEFKNMFSGEIVKCHVELNTYTRDGSTAIELWSEDGPYAMMTTCLGSPPSKGCSYLDVNNFPEAFGIMEKYGFGEWTGRIVPSGFCTYPEFRLNLDALREYEPKLPEEEVA